MSYLLPTKLCVNCNETKDIEKFYKAGKYRQKHCKSCFNRLTVDKRVENKNYKIGFNNLTLEQRNAIADDIKSGMKLKQVAIKNNIGYQRLRRFKQRQLL